jgi:hypothetical protein
MATETPERRRRPILRILAIVGVVLLAIAALSAVSWALRTTERDSVSITESYDQVEVDVSIGEIVIEAGDSDETALAYRTESGLWRDVGVTRRIEGDRLVIDADCNGFLRFPFGYCRADVTLTVPADVDVTARAQLAA